MKRLVPRVITSAVGLVLIVTAFVARPDTPTMPVAIFRYLGRPGEVNFGRAMAMSVLLMLVTAAAVALIERFRTPGLGDF